MKININFLLRHLSCMMLKESMDYIRLVLDICDGENSVLKCSYRMYIFVCLFGVHVLYNPALVCGVY